MSQEESEFERQEREYEAANRQPSERVKLLAKSLSDFVNAYNRQDQEDLVKELFKDHPTLIQSKMRLFLSAIEVMAESNHIDGRNEASKLVCAQVVEGFRIVRAEEDSKRHSFNYTAKDIALPSQYLSYI